MTWEMSIQERRYNCHWHLSFYNESTKRYLEFFVRLGGETCVCCQCLRSVTYAVRCVLLTSVYRQSRLNIIYIVP